MSPTDAAEIQATLCGRTLTAKLAPRADGAAGRPPRAADGARLDGTRRAHNRRRRRWRKADFALEVAITAEPVAAAPPAAEAAPEAALAGPELQEPPASERDEPPSQQPEESPPKAACAGCAEALAVILSRMVAQAPAQSQKLSGFHSARAPALGINAYVERLQKYFSCTDECFVLALVYIDRLLRYDPHFAVNKLSCHRVVVTALMVAAKFNDDIYYSNAYYAKVGGLSMEGLNKMEIIFLKESGWRMNVNPEEYSLYHGMLQGVLEEAKDL